MTRILIADDEKVIRDLYQDFLNGEYNPEDLDLHFAVTGDEAISELEKMAVEGIKPSLVITDNHMPGTKTGMDVIDYTVAKLPGTPVIMIAAENIDKTVGKTALEKGASAYLPKPVDMRVFLKIVSQYVK